MNVLEFQKQNPEITGLIILAILIAIYKTFSYIRYRNNKSQQPEVIVWSEFGEVLYQLLNDYLQDKDINLKYIYDGTDYIRYEKNNQIIMLYNHIWYINSYEIKPHLSNKEIDLIENLKKQVIIKAKKKKEEKEKQDIINSLNLIKK